MTYSGQKGREFSSVAALGQLLSRLLILLLLVDANTLQAAEIDQWCESKWPEVSGRFLNLDQPRYDEFVAAWKQYEVRCGNSPPYKARLASIYLAAGKPDLANRTLADIKEVPEPYVPLLTGLKLKSRLDSLLMQSPVDKDAVNALEKSFDDYVANASGLYLAFELTAFYKLVIGKYEQAEKYAKQALSLNSNDWYSWRTLAFVHEHGNQYREALSDGTKAFAMHKALAKDIEFMTAMARSYASTGDFDNAARLLAILADANPEAKKSEEFNATVDFAARKYQERKAGHTK